MALAFKKFSDVLKGVLTSLSKLTTYTPSSTYTAKYDANGNFLGLISGTNDAAVAAGLTLGSMKEIPANDDLNNYFAPGSYWIGGSKASTLTNMPYTNAWGFVMLSIGISAQYTTQVLFSRMGTYIRYQNNPWVLLYSHLS